MTACFRGGGVPGVPLQSGGPWVFATYSNVTLWTLVFRVSVMTIKWSRRRFADIVIEWKLSNWIIFIDLLYLRVDIMHELSFHFEEIVTIDKCQQNYSEEHVIHSMWNIKNFPWYAVAFHHNLQIVNQFIVAHCRLERDTLLSSFLRPGAFAHAELCRAPIAKPWKCHRVLMRRGRGAAADVLKISHWPDQFSLCVWSCLKTLS